MPARYGVAVGGTTERANKLKNVSPRAFPFGFRTDTTKFIIRDPSTGTFYEFSVAAFDSITAGTAAASKAVIADAQVAIAGLKVALGSGLTATATGGLVGSIADITNNASGTTQSTEYTLNSVTLPANAFNAATRSIQVVAWGQLAANANAKNLKIYFGSVAVATITGSTANAKDFYITLDVVRLALSSQSAVGSAQIDTGAAVTMATTIALTEDETAAIIIAVKSANTAAAAASATGRGMIVSFGN